MAELTTTERLQPSLLDRLTDDAPEQKDESRERRVINAARLRECVMRDLGWLLNTVQLSASADLGAYPQVADSVLNYGIPDLCGTSLRGADVEALKRRIRDAILAFEPRLTPATLQVDVHMDEDRMDQTSLSFDIRSEMWAQPIPMRLYLKTRVDLENGRVDLTESYG
ncbi:type VI secretion system baseplate subunit TssE [Pseudoxanthomonas sp.]|uniref:type VI secretion system baseplate subunit TssE n=1 Tax=Pseudoxanthomonas sp. TaxID=1871049 RepID=UPI002633C65E|nr:type VI secretion system baseplate subunit TssE [Pseudoxanthomonas sp.]WDS37815.1 MAG: type VI secretion system baseplate subunit TssE [Pseudoxanthomonas sp.]